MYTDRVTGMATPVAIRRIYAMHAMRPKTVFNTYVNGDTSIAYRKPRKKVTKRKGHIIHHHCVNAEYISAKELPFGVQILGFIKKRGQF